jgi:hypothetical protein
MAAESKPGLGMVVRIDLPLQQPPAGGKGGAA